MCIDLHYNANIYALLGIIKYNMFRERQLTNTSAIVEQLILFITRAVIRAWRIVAMHFAGTGVSLALIVVCNSSI